MDCCNTKQTKHEKENMKGGKGMVEVKKNTLMWVFIVVLLIATVFLTFKASSIGIGAAQTTASVVKTAASTASSGMVGGC